MSTDTSQNSTRRSFHVEGLGHGANPIPAVSRVGNLVTSGGIMGRDVATGAVGETFEDQCRLMFEAMDKIARAAGITTAAIAKVTIYLSPGMARDAINHEWLKHFPDEHSRPARHVVIYEHFAGNILIQCEFIAFAES